MPASPLPPGGTLGEAPARRCTIRQRPLGFNDACAGERTSALTERRRPAHRQSEAQLAGPQLFGERSLAATRGASGGRSLMRRHAPAEIERGEQASIVRGRQNGASPPHESGARRRLGSGGRRCPRAEAPRPRHNRRESIARSREQTSGWVPSGHVASGGCKRVVLRRPRAISPVSASRHARRRSATQAR